MEPANTPDPPLTVDELLLDAWTPEDAQARSLIFNDPDIARWTRVPFPYTRELAVAAISRQLERQANGELVPFAIRDRSHELLGGIDLMFRGEGRAELGYALASSSRGRGVATRAVTLVGQWAVNECQIERLELPIPVDNLLSRRVAERAGYRAEGTLRSYFELKPASASTS